MNNVEQSGPTYPTHEAAVSSLQNQMNTVLEYLTANGNGNGNSGVRQGN